MPFAAIMKECTIQSSAFYELRDFQTTLDVFNAGILAPHAMITDEIVLNALPEAFEALKKRTHQCKVMVNPGG